MRTINIALTQLMKDLITKHNLIDTGLMLLSTEVHVRVLQRITIEIRSTDYFIYVADRYGLIDEFIASPIFATFLELEYERYLNNYINKIIRGGVRDVNENNWSAFDPTPVITINGEGTDQRLPGDVSAS